MSRNYCKPDHSCQEGGEEGLFRVKWIDRRSQVLSYCPSQNIFGHKQGTYEQWKAMLDKRRKWVPYLPPYTIFRLSLPWTWDTGMDGNPSTREDDDNAIF